MPGLILSLENALTLYKGETKTLELEVADASGAPLSLSGSVVYLTVKKTVSDRCPLLQKSSGDVQQIKIVDADGGKAEIYMGSSDFSDVPLVGDPMDFVFDVWVEYSDGRKYLVVPPAQLRLFPSIRG